MMWGWMVRMGCHLPACHRRQLRVLRLLWLDGGKELHLWAAQLDRSRLLHPYGLAIIPPPPSTTRQLLLLLLPWSCRCWGGRSRGCRRGAIVGGKGLGGEDEAHGGRGMGGGGSRVRGAGVRRGS